MTVPDNGGLRQGLGDIVVTRVDPMPNRLEVVGRTNIDCPDCARVQAADAAIEHCRAHCFPGCLDHGRLSAQGD